MPLRFAGKTSPQHSIVATPHQTEQAGPKGHSWFELVMVRAAGDRAIRTVVDELVSSAHASPWSRFEAIAEREHDLAVQVLKLIGVSTAEVRPV